MGMTFRQHAEKLGAEFLEGYGTQCGRTRRLANASMRANRNLETRTVIFATGAEHARLGVPGEEELNGMGYPTVLPVTVPFPGRTVAVVGGGDVALEDAIYLARTCEKVLSDHRRDSLRGAMVLQEELKVSPQCGRFSMTSGYRDLWRGHGGKAAYQKCEDRSGKDLEAAGIFIAVGIHPNTELLGNWWQSGKTVISLRMRPERPAAPAFMWPEISVRNLCARS